MIGCYVNGQNGITGRGSTGKSNLNMDWERPVNFEYLTPDGKMVINQETSFEVAGGYSRHFQPASFKVQAKKLYDGNGHFAYPVFTNKPYQEYKQLLIRNGGNNNRTDGGPRIKDAITQQVLTTSGFYVDAQEYQPVHVFINGKYLAMMNVREPNNRFHGAANYGYDDDEMDGFEYSSGGYHQKCGTPEVFDRLIQMSYEAYSDEVYERVRELLDIDEFVRYLATICYTGSYDWLYTNNNVKGYRSWEDGKFHFVLFDQDLTWERTNNVETISGVNTNEVLILYNNLKQNRTFRNQFVTAYCILNGSIYTPERCMYIADSICALVKDALSFDNRSTAITYRKLQETMWDEKHREERIQSLMHAYALPNSINVNISTNCAFASIQIEGIDVPFSKFSGELFGPISVNTNSAEGYRFIGWTDQQGRWVNHEKTLQIQTKGTYIAVFERATDNVSPLCINEISAANNIYVNDYGKRADWIELYNRGMEPIDVSQWYFITDGKDSEQYQINAANNVNTMIQPNEHLIVWCDEKPSVSELHLPFKLKNNDNNTLILQSSDGNWKDSIHYNSHSSKETVGRYPDGGTDCWVFYHPTIRTHNLTTSYDREVSIYSNDILPLSHTPTKKAIFNLQGQRISAPQKGINIVDGKKVWVK